MLRFIQQIPRAIRQQWGQQYVRSSPQSVCQDGDDTHAQRTCLLLSSSNSTKPIEVASPSKAEPSGTEARSTDERGVEKTWLHQYRHSYNHVPYTCRDAIGWGSFIVLGLQVVHLWKSGWLGGSKRHVDRDRDCLIKGIYKWALAMPQATGIARHVKHSQQLGPHSYESAKHEQSEHSENLQDLQEVVIDLIQNTALSDGEKVPSLEEAVETWRQFSDKYVSLVLLEEGVRSARQGLYQSAFNKWQRASQSGLDKAHYNLAVCYENGRGVSKDIRKAVEHYELAGKQGHSRSLYNLAMLHLSGAGPVPQDKRLAMQLLDQAAQLGLPQAQRELGVLYTEDDIRDFDRAANLFQAAAEQQDKTALYYLGVCYEQGWGVEMNECKAADLYSRAARLGHDGAQYSLAAYFEKGNGGLPQDNSTALKLYEEALSNGNPLAHEDVLRLRAMQHRKLDEGGDAMASVVPPSFTQNINQHLNQFLDVDSVDDSTQPETKDKHAPSVSFYIGDDSGQVLHISNDDSLNSNNDSFNLNLGDQNEQLHLDNFLAVFQNQGQHKLEVIDTSRRSTSLNDLTYKSNVNIKNEGVCLQHSMSALTLDLKPVSYITCS